MSEVLGVAIPQNLDDLGRHWRVFILSELRRRGRAKFHAEDVLGYVMLKLCESRVVEKFWAGVGERTHQLTVSVPEAAGMLGVSVGDFLAFQIESDEPDTLCPVNRNGQRISGGVGNTSPSARYLFTDVVSLGASVRFPNQGEQVFPVPPPPSVSQWRAYLTCAVSNHSANYTRTYVRRASREHAPDAFAMFVDPETRLMDFESRVIDPVAVREVEQACEVSMVLRHTPGLATRRSADNKGFFDLLREGYTVREAGMAVRLTTRERKVVAGLVG